MIEPICIAIVGLRDVKIQRLNGYSWPLLKSKKPYQYFFFFFVQIFQRNISIRNANKLYLTEKKRYIQVDILLPLNCIFVILYPPPLDLLADMMTRKQAPWHCPRSAPALTQKQGLALSQVHQISK